MNASRFRMVCVAAMGLCLLIWQPAWSDDGPAKPVVVAETQPAPNLGDLLKPSQITLHYTDAPLKTVMDDFTKQAGADLGTHRDSIVQYMSGKKITVNVDHGSFWQALRLIMQESGLTLAIPTDADSGPMALAIASSPGGERHFDLPDTGATIVGPFIIIPRSCWLFRTAEYVEGADSGNAGIAARTAMAGGGIMTGGMSMAGGGRLSSLELVCLCEPKLHLNDAIDKDVVQQMVDEKGHDLFGGCIKSMTIRGKTYQLAGGRTWYSLIYVSLKDHPELGKKIASLKGVIKSSAAVKSSTFVVEDVKKPGPVSQKIGNMTVTFTGLTGQGFSTQLKLSVIWPDNANAAQQLKTLTRMIQLTDGDGEKFGCTPYTVTPGEGGSINLVLLAYPASFDAKAGQHAEPKKLVWELPAESQPVEIPFEIRDLPLPTH